MKYLVVFDLDGTLNRTESYAVPAIRSALAHYGVTKFSAEDIISTFGERDEDTIVKFFGDRAKRLERGFWEEVQKYTDSHPGLYSTYEGVPEMLHSLHESGKLTAVCSNSGMDYITKTLDRLRIGDRIDYLQGLEPGMTKADTLRLLLRRVKPDKAVMAGDRYLDREAAQANRIPFIGCSYGYGTDEELQGSDYIIQSPASVPYIAGFDI